MIATGKPFSMSELVQVMEHAPALCSTLKSHDAEARLLSTGVAEARAEMPSRPHEFNTPEISSLRVRLRKASVFLNEPVELNVIIEAFLVT
jgi:hypothetical protein